MDSSFLKLEPDHDPRKMPFETQGRGGFGFAKSYNQARHAEVWSQDCGTCQAQLCILQDVSPLGGRNGFRERAQKACPFP